MKLTEYLKTLNKIYHVTFNPNGPSVTRIHLIPPVKVAMGISWVVLINGQDILPITTGWAILLKEFIEQVNQYTNKALEEKDIDILIDRTIVKVKEIFPKTKEKVLIDDLKDIIETIVDISLGVEPNIEIGYMKLKDYGKHMKAPHRMDLMISSMMKNNMWNCNQKCLHCYANTQENAIVEELSTQQWKEIIDKLKKACIPQITFTGGEPTLRNDLVELVKYSEYFVTRLNTNGVELSLTLAKDLYDASLDSVQITLYSNTKEIHNLLIGSDKFDKTVQGIKNAIEAKLNVSINTPLCQINKNYLETIKFASKLGVRYFTCSGIIMTGSAAKENSMNTYLSKQEILEVLKEAAKYCEDNFLELSFTSPGWIDEKVLKELGLIIPSCGACASNMAIAPNGEVIPCQSWLTNNSLGNILEKSFDKIWNSKECKKIRKSSLRSDNKCLLAIKEVI